MTPRQRNPVVGYDREGWNWCDEQDLMAIGDLWERVGEIVRHLKESEAMNRRQADPANILRGVMKGDQEHLRACHATRADKEALWVDAWSRVLEGGSATPDELLPAAINFRKRVGLHENAAPHEAVMRATAAFFGLSLAPRVEATLKSFHAKAKDTAQMAATAQEVVRLFGGGDVPLELGPDDGPYRGNFCDQCRLAELDWVYQVKDEIAAEVGMVARELCYRCIQSRLGRKMTLDDLFPPSREQLLMVCEGTWLAKFAT